MPSVSTVALFEAGCLMSRSVGNPEPDRPFNRLNDAKVDNAGRIWAGTKNDRDEHDSGALYRLDTNLNWTRLDDGYGVPNGPTFSPDGSILYHADRARRVVYAFDLSADGRLTSKREFIRFENEWGYPDGMTTDREGGIWIAHWDGGRVSRFRPDGTLERSIHLPASNITSCAFAGVRWMSAKAERDSRLETDDNHDAGRRKQRNSNAH
jgi:D-xylonolactonase